VINNHASDAPWSKIGCETTHYHVHRRLRAPIDDRTTRCIVGKRSHATGRGDNKLALAPSYIVDKRLANPHRTHGVNVKYFRPGVVINITDGLTTSPANAGIVEEQVNLLPLKFCGGRLDASEVSDLQGHNAQFLAIRVSCVWTTTLNVFERIPDRIAIDRFGLVCMPPNVRARERYDQREWRSSPFQV
jgi:hypothetical protein